MLSEVSDRNLSSFTNHLTALVNQKCTQLSFVWEAAQTIPPETENKYYTTITLSLNRLKNPIG